MFNLRLILYSRLLEAVPIQVQQPKPKYDNRKVFFLSSDIPSDTKNMGLLWSGFLLSHLDT